MNNMHDINNKLLHYLLNMDYKVSSQNIDIQTNILINKVINNFIKQESTLFKNKTYIFFNNDDILSIIEYHILCSIRSISDFDFIIYNKPQKIKNYFSKKEKYIKYKQLLALNKDKTLIIESSNNPIYKVLNDNKISNSIIYNYKIKTIYNKFDTYNLFNNYPTPDEIFIMSLFFKIGYQDPIIKFSNTIIEHFNNWCNNPLKYNLDLKNIIDENKPPIYVIYLSNDNIKDSKNLNQMENENVISLYFYKDKPEILEDKLFNWLILRRTNIPSENYGNLNNISLLKDFQDDNYNIKFIGFEDICKKENKTELEIINNICGG